MDKNPGKVRLNPPFWQHDWYSLIQLKQGIAKIIKDNQLGLNNEKIVDIGCGDS